MQLFLWLVATVPTVYGIETYNNQSSLGLLGFVATVPTVYGIETKADYTQATSIIGLQQYLPFTVLKLCASITFNPPLRCNSTYRLRY